MENLKNENKWFVILSHERCKFISGNLRQMLLCCSVGAIVAHIFPPLRMQATLVAVQVRATGYGSSSMSLSSVELQWITNTHESMRHKKLENII